MIKISLYFNCSMLEVICGNWRMKKLEKVDTIFLNIMFFIATFCLTIIKCQSFPIIIDYYSLMRNLYFDCSMLEVISGNWRMKNLEKCRYNILKHNCLYSNFLLNNYKKSEFSNIY